MKRSRISRRRFMKSAAVAASLPLLPAACSSKGRKPGVPEEERGLCFLFQGDSITDGNRGRNKDPNHILGHGYAFAVASRIGADFPRDGFSFYNRGISGNTIRDLKQRWQEDTLQLQPDVLSILVGINDVAAIVEDKPFRQSPERFEEDYREIIQAVQVRNPGIVLVLGIPFVFPVGDRKQRFETWREVTSAHADAVRRMASDYQTLLVDFQEMFEKAGTQAPIGYWIWDGIHPTVFGHELMAREWLGQLGKQLRFLEYYNYSS